MASIKRPGVEVTQENVTAVTATTTPNLATVLVGPCFQIVDAFDDAGAVQSEALAGTYQDGKGTIAYALPSLKTGATVDSDSIRVFRVDGAGASTELRDSDNEETIVSGTSGVYDGSTTFTDSAATFNTSGVQKGDFVRVTYRGEVVDLEITATVALATTLIVKNSIAQSTSITFATYSIVRNPPQFVYKSAAEQADAEIGDATDPELNYLHVAIKSTAASALTGASGDGFKLQLKETDPDYSIAYAATGNGVYTGTGIGDHFNTLNGAVGPASVTSLAAGGYVLISRDGVSPVGAALNSAVDDYLVAGAAGSGSDGFAVLVTPTSLGSSPQAVLGKIINRITADGTVYTHSGTTVTFTGHGLNFADDSGGTGLNYVYIDDGTNAGLYPVTDSTNPNALVISSTNPGTNITFSGGSSSGQQVLALKVGHSSPVVALTVGDLISVYDYSATSTVATVLGSTPSGKSIVFGSDAMASAQYKAISAVSGRVLTVAALSSGASGKEALAVATTASTNFVEPSGSSVTYQIELPRTGGESTVTIATLASDLTSNSTFSANFTATAVDSGTNSFTYAEVTTVDFDGGVDADNILVDEDLIGSTTATHSIYVSYKALRVDVSDQASSPALVEINNTTDVTNLLGKISTDNPLALAAYFATLQSPSTTVKCLGVSATSTAEPSGTTAAYSSALTYLEGQDVYSLACLSTDPAIQALFETHVTSMSAAENKSERIAFVSQDMPSYTPATLLSSGTAGNTPSDFTSSSYSFTTNVDFSLNAALTTVLADTASDDLILVVTARSASTDAPSAANGVLPIKYGVKVDKSATSTQHSTDSSVLKIQSAEAAATTWNSLADVTWSLFQMGTALTTTAQKATAVENLGSQFENKRVFLVWPDSATASLSGSATVVGGEYLAAAWAAKVGYEKPEQPFTNTKLTGFSSLSNSNTLFSRSQLDNIAGGGVWITVQDKPTSSLSCRHQLSTLVDTIQNRELSITKTVDHVAKRLRAVLEPKIGSFRITQSYLDSLGVIVEGELRNFVETGVLTSGKVNFVEVDDTDLDTVNIQVIITVPFPANYIALTLQF